MFSLPAYRDGLICLLLMGVLVWLVSVARRNVAIVDSLWSLMFVVAAVVYACASTSRGGIGGMARIGGIRRFARATARILP
jgi:steroid 5-alpha reductase family enzyme